MRPLVPWILVLTGVFSAQTHAQPVIGAIWLDQREVFDSTTSDEWFFAAPLLGEKQEIRRRKSGVPKKEMMKSK